jgi:hypothetical protein
MGGDEGSHSCGRSYFTLICVQALVNSGLQIWKVVHPDGIGVRAGPDHESARTGTVLEFVSL